MGALGASLGGMVANLSAGKRGWDDKLEYFSGWAVKAQQLKDELLSLVDEDTAAFNKVMDALALPKESAEEKATRAATIEEATKHAAEIPLKVMETASRSYALLAEMAERGNPVSISDVGVGTLATRACIEGAALNVRINLGQLKKRNPKRIFRRRFERSARIPRHSSRPSSRLSKAAKQIVKSLAVLHASQLVTLAGPNRFRVGAKMSTLAIIQDGGMLIRDGKIDLVGASTEIENKAGDSEVIDARGKVVLPGFVDAHTHLVFAGNRLDDFERRARGERTNKS